MPHSKNKQATGNPKEHVREGFSEMKKDAQTLKEDAEMLADDTVEMASHAKEHAVDAMRSTAESAAEMAHGAQDSATKYHNAMCEQIRKHPTSSVMIALGAGLVIGRIMGGANKS